MKRLAAALLLVLLAGCGGDDAEPLTVALDFTPNANHAPLYAAREAGAIRIRKPAANPDVLKLVAAGKAELGVLDIHDLALARARGSDVVAVSALIGKPLAALVARAGGGISRPRDLEGRTVGVSGLPSDPAFLRAIVEDDGGDPDRVRQVTIGFSAVTRLISGRVDAAPVFWNAEGVVLGRELDTREFRVDDYGAPPYPELVLITSRATLEERRDDIRAALTAVEDGIAAVRDDPEAAARQVAEAAETDDTALVRAQLAATEPLFSTTLDRAVLEAWAEFDARIGIVEDAPDVDAAFDFTLR